MMSKKKSARHVKDMGRRCAPKCDMPVKWDFLFSPLKHPAKKSKKLSPSEFYRMYPN